MNRRQFLKATIVATTLAAAAPELVLPSARRAERRRPSVIGYWYGNDGSEWRVLSNGSKRFNRFVTTSEKGDYERFTGVAPYKPRRRAS